MGSSLGAQLFWMITIGLTIGYASHYLFLKYSISLGLSIGTGIVGAVCAGLISYHLAYSLPLMFAVLGSLTFLFIANAFLSQED
ncbi:MAG TPA: hypothetical protein VK074_09020 [Fodinibius sp.]|nr:hypothetical protein [Fodinibius sp.]